MSVPLSIAAMAVSISTPLLLYIIYIKFERAKIANEFRDEVSKLKAELINLSSRNGDSEKNNLAEILSKISSIEEKLGFLEKKVIELEDQLHEDVENVKTEVANNNNNEEFENRVIELRKQGYSLRRIAEELKIPISRVRKILKEYNIM